MVQTVPGDLTEGLSEGSRYLARIVSGNPGGLNRKAAVSTTHNMLYS